MTFVSFPYGWLWGLSRDAPPPPPESLRTDGRSLVRWRHNQIFSAWWVTNFALPWCFAGALRALKLRYKRTRICSGLHFPETHKNWVLLSTVFLAVLANLHVHNRCAILLTQKILFDTFQPSTMKLSQPSSTRQKGKSDEDPPFSSKWLEEFAWLVYVSTENHMNCKMCGRIWTFG